MQTSAEHSAELRPNKVVIRSFTMTLTGNALMLGYIMLQL